MTTDTKTLTHYEPEQTMGVTLVDGRSIPILGKGAVNLMGNQGRKLTLSEMVHAPTITTNLISVRGLKQKGAKVIFEGDQCTIINADIVVATKHVDESDQSVLRFENNATAPATHASVSTYPQGGQ